MRLFETENECKELLEKGRMDSYALLVRKGEETAFLFSDSVDSNTLFEMASLTKVLVTLPLVFQAMGEGKLSLESRLSDFFDFVPKEKKNITVFQLLTHTSGVGEILVPKKDKKDSFLAARAILQAPLSYSPGSEHRYSCMGFILLGKILEQIYHQPLDFLFESRIKEPLGLSRSGFLFPHDGENGVISYRRSEPGSYRVDDENAYAMGGVSGNAGVFFSLRDLEIVIKAIMTKDARLYPQPFYALAEQDYTQEFSQGRGLGWLMVDDRYEQTADLFPVGSFGHCGYTGTSLFFSREKDLSVALLTNAARFAYQKHPEHEFVRGQVSDMRIQVHKAIGKDLSETD